jgi:hypothetical protein
MVHRACTGQRATCDRRQKACSMRVPYSCSPPCSKELGIRTQHNRTGESDLVMLELTPGVPLTQAKWEWA